MDNNLTPDRAKTARNNVYTKEIQDAILNRSPNNVLHEPASEISPEELALPRAYLTTLSQLCAGHCIALNDYRATICLTSDA